MTYSKPALAVVALLALAACDEDMSGSSDMMATPQMQPAPGGPPFIETMDASVSNAAVSACRSALEATTTGGVTVVGSEFSQANTAIYMRVGANGAPWRCLVSADGSNPSLEFQGSEGAA
ncbi:hypothetical protein ATO8_12781 [Roseivivax marinus]|uniref:Lipoprotein n=1 Tax=Roseivivax marinus TaxID=1379903 RepID=W4HI73_9RHOB|nr:hypothetical protein [Roseivivax marinus]ETW12427.1 hypothetical protein ATO8_12781 [Roseivivax marinus]SEK25606.1 hypothetical protein SAMN05444413_101182 [Roseivivax marinus]